MPPWRSIVGWLVCSFVLKIPPLLPRVYQTPARVRTGLMCAPRLMQAPPRLLACCHEGTLLAHAQLVVHHEAFCKGAFQLVGPARYPWGYPSPRAGLCPSFLNFRRSLLAHSFRLERPFLTAAQPSGASDTPPSLALSTKLPLQPGH